MSLLSLMPSRPTDPQPARSLPARIWAWADQPDSAAMHGLISGAVWFVVGTVLGLIASHEMTMPDLFAGIPWLTWSRVRPAHVNTVLYGFLATSYWGAWYFILPRIFKTPLQTNRHANILVFLWNIGVGVGMLALLGGDTQGREYTEYPWYVDWAVEFALIFNVYIIFKTMAMRREPRLYVSAWYIGGTAIWIAILYAIGSVMWHPFTTYLGADGHSHFLLNTAATNTLPVGVNSFQRSGSIVGLDDAVWHWFYAHNVLGLLFTTGGVGIIYYLVPKISKRPLYSHTMSLIGFWSIALLYTETGQHHLLQAPIPNWLKVVAIIGSISLIIPVFTFITNVMMTLRGTWGEALTNIPLRYVVTGTLFYVAASFQGSVQALMSVNRFIHFTQWVIAHSHLALLGGFGFVVCGAMYYMVPQIVRRRLWSRNLADAQYWLMLLGITGYFWSITAAGLAQASAWVSLGQQVVRAFEVVKPYFVMRSWFGSLFVIGAVMMIVNLVMTVRTPAPTPADRRRDLIANLEEMPPLQTSDDRILAD